jgi:integrase
MRKLRFKNRNGILYFGFGDKLKSSKRKYNQVNKKIIFGMWERGELDHDLMEKSTAYTVAEMTKEVIESKRRELKHTTILAYDAACRIKIMPYFQDRLVTEIKPIDIKRFYDVFVEDNLSNGSINLSKVLLTEVFNNAILEELITVNPVKMVKMPKARKKKKKQMPCSLDEIDQILEACIGQVRNFLGISFFTGMRSGELMALKWEDVDFQTDTITINKTVSRGFISSPKTRSSEREIEIIPKAKEFFNAQKRETGLQKSYVFLNKKNDYFPTNQLFYKQFKAILNKLGFTVRSLHNTRHTFASIMLNNKIEPLWVSNTLGHENLDITLRVYTHFMPRKEKMTIGFLEKRYKNGTNTA